MAKYGELGLNLTFKKNLLHCYQVQLRTNESTKNGVTHILFTDDILSDLFLLLCKYEPYQAKTNLTPKNWKFCFFTDFTT